MVRPEGSILDAYFTGRSIALSGDLYQYDYGQILRFNNVDLPEHFEVHFSNHESVGTSSTVMGTNAQVAIPDKYLLTGLPIYFWVYLHDASTDGETEYNATITVITRPKPEDYIQPVERDFIAQAIDALNVSVVEANEAAESAEKSAVKAEESAANAEESAANVQHYAELAEQSAQSASQYAQSAGESAEAAEQYKTSASRSAEDASSSASSAAESASHADLVSGQIDQKASDALKDISEAKTDAISNVNSAKSSALSAISSAQSSAVKAVGDKGKEVLDSIPADYSDLTEDVTSLKSAFDFTPSPNLSNPDAWVSGVLLKSDGTENHGTSAEPYSTCDYIPVSGISELGFYYLNLSTGGFGAYTSARHICAYDSNKAFITGSHDDTHDGTYSVPANAVYVRFSVNTGHLTSYKLMVCSVDESTPTAFIPYGVTGAFKQSNYATFDYADSLSFANGTPLTLGADLDLLEDGVYYSSTSSITNSLIHKPVSQPAGACKVITFTWYSSYKAQYLLASNNRIYYRTSTSDGYKPWAEIGNILEYLKVQPVDGVGVQFGEEIAPDLSTFSGINATYENAKWDVKENGSISASVEVEANATYLVNLTVEGAYTGADENGVPGHMNIVLGTDSISIFAANDAYWNVALTPTNGGSVPISFASEDHWYGNITGVSIRKVLNPAPILMTLYSQNVRVTGSNFNMGGYNKFVIGAQNVGIGPDSQMEMTTARWNTAVGNHSQTTLRNGTGNTAVGASAQGGYGGEINRGSYNNCVGNATQLHITSGNWNNAFGNESQLLLTEGCNNTSMGRRSSTALTKGHFNTHIGMWAGFNGKNVNPSAPDYNQNTVTASRQTLVGAKTRQIDHQSDDLVCLGFGAHGDERSVAIGSGAKAQGAGSIAIGYGVHTAEGGNEVAIGSNGQKIILAGKVITFNDDGTVTWETV